jgi:hypothetical protein
MRRLITALLLLALPSLAAAQTTTAITSGASLPATCIEGRNLFYKTGASEGLYVCSNTDTWTILASGVASGAPSDATYVTLATDGTLTQERVLTGTASQITVTDGGAGAAVTLSTPQNIATTSTPQFARVGFGAAADASAVAYFNGLYVNDETVDDGNSSTADTIDWATGNVHYSTLTGNVTYTFSNPKDSAGLILFINTGAGSFTATWPAAVKWFGGAAPTITTTADKVDVVVCRYLTISTSYYCSISQNANE